MSKLITVKEDGIWHVNGADFDMKKLSSYLYGALYKLKHYEEICDSPDKLREIDEMYREKCEEVNRLKAELEKSRLPIKVGDKVYLKAYCECVCMSKGCETGIEECPFENDCEFEECNNGNERLFKSTVESIWNEGTGWLFSVRGLCVEISVNDIGKYVFLTEEAAEQNCKNGVELKND